jgi:hypothetical protein
VNVSRLAWRLRLSAAYRRISVSVIWFLITSKSIDYSLVKVNRLISLFSAPISLLTALVEKPEHASSCFHLLADMCLVGS